METVWSVERLYAALNEGASLAILDVRNEDEFAAGSVEGRHEVPTAHVPYFDFIDDADAALARIPFPKELPVVVVCAKGGSSEFVADLMRDAGWQAINMEGGMARWADALVPVSVTPADHPWTLVQFNRPGKAALSYMIVSDGEAMVVDPARDPEPYLTAAAAHDVRITHVMDTHVHADYVSGGVALARSAGATYHLSGACGYEGDLAVSGQPGPIRVGRVEAIKLSTPGHTPGSMSLHVDGHWLLTGDTLFVASVGRPDLGGEVDPWARDLHATLTGVLADLPDDTVVLPAHYASHAEMRSDGVVAGTLGALRRDNEGMQARDLPAFLAFIHANMRPSPEHYATIRRINLGALEPTEDQVLQLDQGKNQCAASMARKA
ncbi:MAG: MBL fold metallo-hydrolase [Candidatus Sericytochromatia bacterium]|nr:MBL fold metallo-hydrolase [Candidatus Sericytochromatia bacterium]